MTASAGGPASPVRRRFPWAAIPAPLTKRAPLPIQMPGACPELKPGMPKFWSRTARLCQTGPCPIRRRIHSEGVSRFITAATDSHTVTTPAQNAPRLRRRRLSCDVPREVDALACTQADTPRNLVSVVVSLGVSLCCPPLPGPAANRGKRSSQESRKHWSFSLCVPLVSVVSCRCLEAPDGF